MDINLICQGAVALPETNHTTSFISAYYGAHRAAITLTQLCELLITVFLRIAASCGLASFSEATLCLSAILAEQPWPGSNLPQPDGIASAASERVATEVVLV